MVEIGSKYEGKKAELRRRIREKTIDALLFPEAEFHACYFCCQRIEGKAWELIDFQKIDGVEVESKYFLDDHCFREAGRNFYIDKYPISLN